MCPFKNLWTLVSVILLHGMSIDADPIRVKHDESIEFVILHNNDMHSRFEQTNVHSQSCSPEEVAAKKCYGGFARVAHLVNKYRTEAKKGLLPVFYMNAGDTFAGTAWFTTFKQKIVTDFLNELRPDVISLGNHEFDEKVASLASFLNEINFPVVACNLDVSKEPELVTAKNLYKSTILDANGIKIGVIGYLTPETQFTSMRSKVQFHEEIASINAEAARLKSQGIKIIIALGHSGYKKDQDIAKHCPEVDIVIGGHTNTFLNNGEKPSLEPMSGPYPTIITQASGKRVPVVQAYAYTKYLGKLHVKFDLEGNLIDFDGSPILLDAGVHQDSQMLNLLERYRANITALERAVVAHTKVHLDGRRSSCRSVECNLGNLMTDAMVFSRALEDRGGDYWTDASIALHQSGGIRSSIERKSDGAITKSDFMKVFPFENNLYVSRITGRTLREALEYAVSKRSTNSNGAFLQVSGVHVVYDLTMPEGHKIVSLEVRCANCSIPSYSPLVEAATYNVIVPQFAVDGGLGLNLVEEGNPLKILMRRTTLGALWEYLSYHSYILPEVEGRIVFNESKLAN